MHTEGRGDSGRWLRQGSTPLRRDEDVVGGAGANGFRNRTRSLDEEPARLFAARTDSEGACRSDAGVVR